MKGRESTVVLKDYIMYAYPQEEGTVKKNFFKT